MNYASEFRNVLEATLGPLSWQPIGDGELHWFHIPGDPPGALNGWYLLFTQGIASAVFSCSQAEKIQQWSSRNPADQIETQLIHQRMGQAHRDIKDEQNLFQRGAAAYANRLWESAKFADPEHPYLLAKNIRTYALRQDEDILLVPLTLDDQLVNLQMIRPNGDWRFVFGGTLRGACSIHGKIIEKKPLYICESWAIGAMVHTETGTAVASCMSTSNLLSAGRLLQRQHPNAILIIGAVVGTQIEDDPRRAIATSAAAELGCDLLLSSAPVNAPYYLPSFSDLLHWRTNQ